MASTTLATSLGSSTAASTAASAPVLTHSDLPEDTRTSSGDTSSLPTPTLAVTKELGVTSSTAASLGRPSSPTLSAEPDTATLIPSSNIIHPAGPTPTASPTSTSRSRPVSMYRSSLLPTATASYSMASVASPQPTPTWPAPTTTVPLQTPSLPVATVPPAVNPTLHQPPLHIYIAVGAAGGAALICLCLVVTLIACGTYKTGCKSRKWKRMMIRNRKNTEYMHKDAFWAGSPKELPKQNNNPLHPNGTIKDGQEQGRRVSPQWSPSHTDESIDEGNAHLRQNGGEEGSQKNWTIEPHQPRISETSFTAEYPQSLHADPFSTASHRSNVTHTSKSCSPPHVASAVAPETLATDGVEPVAYVNVQHARGKGGQPVQKTDKKKKKPLPIPHPVETAGYVNVGLGEPLNSQALPTLPRDRSGYTPVLIHGEQVSRKAPDEGCYDVPRSAAVPLTPPGSRHHGTALSTQAFNFEADNVRQNGGAGKTHYAVPKGNTVKPGKVPPFVAPKPQTSGSHNNSVYDCPKGTPVQAFPAAVGPPYLGGWHPEDVHGSSGTSQYDRPRTHLHLTMQKDETSGVYDAPRIHSPAAQYPKATSPPGGRILRRESQYDIPRSSFQFHDIGNPDIAQGYDSLARYPPTELQSLPHSMVGAARRHSAIIGIGHQVNMFRLPPHPTATAHSSGTGHYDVPRSPHTPAL